MDLLISGFLGSLFDVTGSGIGKMFAVCIGFCTQNPFDSSSWANFSWINTVTLYIQALALAIVIALRIMSGITSGIFANGGDPQTGESPGQWLFHSLWVVGLVCALPTIVRWICGLTAAIASNLTGVATATDYAAFPGVLDGFLGDALRTLFELNPAGTIVKLVLSFVCLYYMASVMIVCLGRQVQLVVMSVIAPFTCITATGDDMNMADIMSICRDMLWVGVNNGLQITLLMTAMNLTQNAEFMHIMGPLYPLAAIAMFKAVKDVPGWIEKWTPNQVQAGRMGGRTMGAAAAGGRMVALRGIISGGKA